MLANAGRCRSLALVLYFQARPSSTGPPHQYDIPYSPIVEAVRKRIAITHGLKSRVLSDPQADIYNSTLMRIRQAVKDKNARAVVDHWQHLERRNLLRFLRNEQIQKISELLTTSFQSTSDMFCNWDKATQDVVNDIAVRAASCCVDSLSMFMLLYIKRSDPDTVISLYEVFTQAFREQEMLREVHDDEQKSGGLDTRRDFRSNHPGRVSILLAVTTAHTMKNSFQGALDVWITTSIRFYPTFAHEFLRKLDHDPAILKRVKDWIPRLNIAMQISRPPSFSRRIVDLASGQDVRAIEKLYQAVIGGLTGPNAFIAAQEPEITPTKRVAMSTVSWTSFLTGFIKCQRRDLAMKLWDDMTTLGVRPGVSLWTALIDSYDGVNAVDDAFASWKMMRAQNIEPNALAYRAVVSALFNGRKPDIALQIFREYQKSKPGDPQHNISVYNTVLHGLLLTDRIEEAKHLLRNMVDTGPSPDTVSYNTFLAYYSRRGDFKELANVVNDMANANLVGDVFSFSTILSALLKAGREDAPDVIFQLMQKQGIEPNVATYSAIIDHQMRAHDEQNTRAAILMLQKMELDSHIHPNEVTYTSILAGLHRNRHLPNEKVQEWTRDILRKMKERGIKFQLPTYHILIKACLSNPLPDGLQAAMKYYYELKKTKLRMNHTTWYILLAGTLQRGEWAIADEIVKDMFETGIQPSGSVLELISRIRKRLH